MSKLSKFFKFKIGQLVVRKPATICTDKFVVLERFVLENAGGSQVKYVVRSLDGYRKFEEPSQVFEMELTAFVDVQPKKKKTKKKKSKKNK